MRHLAWLVLVVACDHRPAPRKSPTPIDAAVPVADAAPVDVTQACTDVGVKVASIWVDSATNPTEKAQLEQERTRIVRTMADTCTKAQWSEAARNCMLAATTRGGLQQCQQQHVLVPATAGAGSGSAS